MTTQFYDEPGVLVEAVKALIEADPRTIVEIASDLRMNYFWLRNFHKGKLQNPSVNRIEYVYTKLAKKKLIIG